MEAPFNVVRHMSNMCTVLVTLDLNCIWGYNRVESRILNRRGHKYEATPIVTMR
jgi:hypothetical protein